MSFIFMHFLNYTYAKLQHYLKIYYLVLLHIYRIFILVELNSKLLNEKHFLQTHTHAQNTRIVLSY